MKEQEFTYIFQFPDGAHFRYPLRIDDDTRLLTPAPSETLPDWTLLEPGQCPHCPLTKDRSPRCPVAVNIAQLVEAFREVNSTLPVKITVHTEARTYLKEGPVQRGLSSILGLIMATSGCPHLNFLKPMARFHLPFQTAEETIVRSTSLYLLGQYFIAKRGGSPDLALRKLEEAYARVQQVNASLSERIRSAAEAGRGDATSNAVVILDTVSQLLSLAIEDDLDDIEGLFNDLLIG